MKRQRRRQVPSQREERDLELYLALCDWRDADWDDLEEGHINFWRLFDALKRMKAAMRRYDPGLRLYGREISKKRGILS